MVRLKHRYLVGQVLFDPMGTTPTINTSASSSSCFPSSSTTSHTVGEISQRDLQYALGKELQRLFGDVGVGMFGLGTSFRYFDPRSYLYVVRTSREESMKVQFALTCISEIKRGGSTVNVVLKTLGISGSTRTCKAFLMKQLTTSSSAHRNTGEGYCFSQEQINRLEL